MNNEPDAPKRGGMSGLMLAHVVCCGGMILVFTGALSGLGTWLLDGGMAWLLLAAVLGVAGWFQLRRRASRAGTRGEPRQSETRPPVRRVQTNPSEDIVRPAGERQR